MKNKKVPVCLLGAGRIGLYHEFDKKGLNLLLMQVCGINIKKLNLELYDINIKSKK